MTEYKAYSPEKDGKLFYPKETYLIRGAIFEVY